MNPKAPRTETLPTRASGLPLGRVLGSIDVPASLARAAEACAREFWTRQVESGFSEQVETVRPPRSVGSLSWLPTAQLLELGLARDRGAGHHEWVMTADVDPHEDDAWGITLLWVLVNPRLKFRQGKLPPIVPSPGDWLLFDDRVQHAVEAGKGTPEDGIFLAWSVRLRVLERRSAKGASRPGRPEILEERPAGPDHQVVTVRSASKTYRRQPCAGCPWRKENDGSFPAEAFRHSARTAFDMSTHVFACHESGIERSQTCAGFLLRGAEHNLAVRMGYSSGRYSDDVTAGGAELHEGYRAMAVANGVDPGDPILAQCCT